MEAISLSLDPKEYDRMVENGAPRSGLITLALKRKDPFTDRGYVAIGFEAEVDGKKVLVQAVTTLRAFAVVARPLIGYADSEY